MKETKWDLFNSKIGPNEGYHSLSYIVSAQNDVQIQCTSSNNILRK